VVASRGARPAVRKGRGHGVLRVNGYWGELTVSFFLAWGACLGCFSADRAVKRRRYIYIG
jgi:hypothetical protein